MKRQSGSSASTLGASGRGSGSGGGMGVEKAELEALKVKIVKKFLLSVLFSAQNDEKRTNETKVRPLHSFYFCRQTGKFGTCKQKGTILEFTEMQIERLSKNGAITCPRDVIPSLPI